MNSNDNEFYGEFIINSVYEMKNFNNMLISNFPCKIDNVKDNKMELLFYGDFILIIFDDCFTLIKNFLNKKRRTNLW